MTPAAWRALIGRINLDGLTPPVRLRYVDYRSGAIVAVTRLVTCVESGQLEEITVGYDFEPHDNARSAAYWLLGLVCMNLGHEAAHYFKVDGVACFEPKHGAQL